MPYGARGSKARPGKLSLSEAKLLESVLDEQSKQAEAPLGEQALQVEAPADEQTLLVEAPSETQPEQAAEAPTKEQSKKAAKDSSETTLFHELKMLFAKLAAMAVVCLLLLTFVFGLHYNVDSDMHPAVKDGDLVLYNRWSKDYVAGDLAVLSYQGETQVRRVIAVAGDTVDIVREGLVVNGALKQEQDITELTQRYAGGVDFPITLQTNEIFVLGDARGGATDSRIYGLVQIDNTHGTVMTLLRRRGL